MPKYLIDSEEIEIIEVAGTENIKLKPIKHYINATISQDLTISSQTPIAIDTVMALAGNFTLNNNKIIIGSNINHVRISACISADDLISGKYLGCRVTKNGANEAYLELQSNSTYMSISIPSFIVGVNENDEISLIADTDNISATIKEGISKTWICIEKID
jgi:hypothetical protein